MTHDVRGVPVSSGTAASLARYETALRQFQTYVGDPIATLDAALADDPEFIAGHLFRALALYTLSERKYLPEVQRSLREANARAGRCQRPRTSPRARRAASCYSGEWHCRVPHARSRADRPPALTRSRCRSATCSISTAAMRRN
jgi:hypothetical protein